MNNEAMLKCSINVNKEDDYTCFTKNELLDIINTFNKYIINKNLKLCNKETKQCIANNNLNIITVSEYSLQNKKVLWAAIYNELYKLCPYEFCWKDLNFIDKIPNQLKKKFCIILLNQNY